MARPFLLFALFLGLILPVQAQVGLPMQNDGRVDYSRLFAPQKPVEIVFCLDISGSMWQQNLPNAQARLLEIYQIARQTAGRDQNGENLVSAGLLLYYDKNTFFLAPKPLVRSSKTELLPLYTDSQTLVRLVQSASVYNIYSGYEALGTFNSIAQKNFLWHPNVARHLFFLGNQAIRDSDYLTAAQTAKANGWRVHSVLCEKVSADYASGGFSTKQWVDMAWAGGGTFSCLGISARSETFFGPVPDVDAQIVALSRQWNATCIPYGPQGLEQLRALLAGDESAFTEFYYQFLPRVQQKIVADVSDWDLISAFANAKISENAQGNLWPAGWAALAPAVRRAQILEIAKKRAAIALQLRQLFFLRAQQLTLMRQRALLDQEVAVAAAQAQAEAMREAQRAFIERQREFQRAQNPQANENPDANTPVWNLPNPKSSTENNVPQTLFEPEAPASNSDFQTEKNDDLASLSDEFSDSQTLDNWKNRVNERLGSQNEIGVEIKGGRALVKSGAILRTLSGPFSMSAGLVGLKSGQIAVAAAIFPRGGEENQGARLRLDVARGVWEWEVDGKIAAKGELESGDWQIKLRRERGQIRAFLRRNDRQKWKLLAVSNPDWLQKTPLFLQAGIEAAPSAKTVAVAVDWIRFRRNEF